MWCFNYQVGRFLRSFNSDGQDVFLINNGLRYLNLSFYTVYEDLRSLISSNVFRDLQQDHLHKHIKEEKI